MMMIGSSEDDDDTVTVDSQRALEDAASNLRAANPIRTSFHIFLVTAAKPKDLQHGKFFPDLSFSQLSDLSTDTSAKRGPYNSAMYAQETRSCKLFQP